MSSVILACSTLRKAVQHAQELSKTNYPVYELDRAYHDDPAQMRQHILETLAALPAEVDTVLVAMGFCGGSWQDVSCDKRLVIPKVADCVALTLTTEDTYSPDLKQPGHMYLFGDKQSGFSIRAIYALPGAFCGAGGNRSLHRRSQRTRRPARHRRDVFVCLYAAPELSAGLSLSKACRRGWKGKHPLLLAFTQAIP